MCSRAAFGVRSSASDGRVGVQIPVMLPAMTTRTTVRPATSTRADTLTTASDIATPTANAPSADLTRGLRGKLRTRAKLIEAAMRVMGSKGVEGATINEITEAADVGFGSFYNHFKTKEEIAHAVFELLNEDLALRLDHISAEVEDVAQRLAYILLTIVRKAVVDPVWGWFLVHAQSALQVMENTYRERCASDLRQGIATDRFAIGNIDVAVTITLTALMGFVKSILEGSAAPADAHDLAELLLRMYGVPQDEARRVAKAKVPKAYQL